MYQPAEQAEPPQLAVVVGAAVSAATEKLAAAESRPAPLVVVTLWAPAGAAALASKL